MARFLLWSDLHVEFAPFDFFSMDYDGVDAILMAGDTASKGRHIEAALQAYEASKGLPVVMVHGNHEAYGRAILDVLGKEAEILSDLHARGVDIHVLHGDAVEIAGTRIVGAALWSDFNLDPTLSFHARTAAEARMNDYHAIRLGGTSYRRLKTSDTIGFHARDRAAIFSHLDTPYDGNTLVMTHHMPSASCISEAFAGDILNAAFASEMLPEIAGRPVHTWVYGHSHDNREFDFEGDHGIIRFRSNPRGYPGEKTRFDPRRIIEV